MYVLSRAANINQEEDGKAGPILFADGSSNGPAAWNMQPKARASFLLQ